MRWVLLAAGFALVACTSTKGNTCESADAAGTEAGDCEDAGTGEKDAGSECGSVDAGDSYTEVSTFAGGGSHEHAGNSGGFVDGDASIALFDAPGALAFDDGGYLYVADQGNNAIRRIDREGNVTTFAGLGPDAGGFVDGNASTARFLDPVGVAISPTDGTLYVADLSNHAVRRIDPQGNVSTLAGLGPNASGFVDGNASVATFHDPTGLVVDLAGNVYVADTDNNAVRMIDPQGNVTTVAGHGGDAGFGDGKGGAASFNGPGGSMAIDGAGNIFVADTGNDAIRKIDPLGNVTTLAGLGSPETGGAGFDDGNASIARFYYPSGVAVDGAGIVYVVDSVNNAVRRIDSCGSVSTVAGQGFRSWGFVDGNVSVAKFYGPTSIALDQKGDIFVSEFDNNAIRKISR